LLEAVSIPVVTLHLLAADLAAVGPLVALWFSWRAARGDRLAADVERGLLRGAIWALIAAAALGGAALGLLWLADRQAWFEAARQIPARRYWFGLIELIFSWACLGAARWLARRQAAAGFDSRFSARFALTALAGTNLAYHFPPLFSAIGVLSTRPEAWGGTTNFLSLLADSEVLARTLHHLLAAGAVTGAAIMLGALRWRTTEESDDRRRVAAWGARIALAASALQLLAGLHLLFQLPAASRERLMGGDMLAGLLFAAALLVTVTLLHRLAAIAFGDAQGRAIVIAALLIALVMLLMAATRHRTRNAASPSAVGAKGPSEGKTTRARKRFVFG
jgi:cytochrome bd-type quinol oxidase subunit 1